MCSEVKIARVIEWLTEGHLGVIESSGYPFDYAIHNGVLFVAEIDQGQSRIACYKVVDLIDYYDSVEFCMKEQFPGQVADFDLSFDSNWRDVFLDQAEGLDQIVTDGVPQ